MHFVSKVVAGLIAALLVSGCLSSGSRGGPIPYDSSGFVAPDAPRAATIDSTYLISPGDTLAVKVFQADNLSQDYKVDAAGNVSMPLIGSVPVIGMTAQAAAGSIARKLDAKYTRNADVTLTVKESVSRNVTVDGSVRQPGVFPVTTDLTLIQAIALARGTDQDANPRRVAIFRTVDGKRMAAAFDLTSIRRGEMDNPRVYPGDIVVVDGNRTNSAIQQILGTLPVLALFRPF